MSLIGSFSKSFNSHIDKTEEAIDSFIRAFQGLETFHPNYGEESMNRRDIYRYVYYPAVLYKSEGFFRALNALAASQYYEQERINAIQFNKLMKMVAYAKSNIPVYRKLYKDINVNDIRTLGDLKHLPFITKAMLKQDAKSFEPYKKEWRTTKKTTGGSTGQPLTIIKNRKAFASELAATWRGYEWAGIRIGDRQARFWGIPFKKKDRLLARATDLLCNRMRLSAFAFTKESLEKYTEKLVKFRPDYFYGYVSMLDEYCEYFISSGIQSPFKLKAIVTTSEVLHDESRDKIESVFKTKIFNEYGCGEIGSIAHECKCGAMHICAENMILEVINDGNVCKTGELGEIVVTELNNSAMPLIRYKIGDFARYNDKRCECGVNLPVIEDIKGRAYDTIRLPDGKMFHGEFFMYIFEDAKRKNMGIAKFQVIQTGRKEISLRIVREKGYGIETEGYICMRIREGMGDVRILFEYVDDIEREKSGKMRLIRSMENTIE